MARPRTKQDLIQAGEAQYTKLMDLIATLSEETQKGEFHFEEATLGKEAHWKRDHNIRDIFIHLYEWHQLLLHWVENNQKGEEKPFLMEGYNWKTYGDMNVFFWKKHQNTSYEEAKKMLEKSHQEVMQLADKFTNEELFTKGVYPWVGGSTLGSYFVSVTASHYDWAIKKIKVYIKSIA